MANITNVNELWGRKWRFKDDTPSPSEFSLRNSVTGVKFATFYLGEEVKEVYQSGSNVGNVGITTQGTFIRIGASASSYTYVYTANGWGNTPVILEFVENTENYTLSCTNEENFITWFNENATEYVPPLSEWTKGVADAIREKKGTSGLIKPLDFAKEISSIEAGGGVEINGLIEEYKVYAGENINAGDFVEFVNNVCKGLNTKYNSACYYAPSCCLLEENKVFIAHIQSLSNGSFLYGAIVEISGTEMTATITTLNNTTQIYMAVNCVLLENNKVFIAHSYGGDRCLAATIVEINGATMTPTTTQLNSEKNSCYQEPYCILLENNKVFIAHSYSSDYHLYGTIVTINGIEMTATTTQFNNTIYSCRYAPSCVLLENNKVFIAHSYSSYYYLYGTIVTINGTNMTPTTTQLNNSNYASQNAPSCCLLEENKVFIAHSYGYNGKYLSGTIVTINGTNMTPTTTQLNSEKNSCYYTPNCCLLEENKVFIAHSYGSSQYLYETIVEINGTTITPKTTQLNSTVISCYYAPSCCLLEPNKVFISHSYTNNKYLYATIYFGQQVIPMNDVIKGIAKTSGTGGETIQVFVPNTGV